MSGILPFLGTANSHINAYYAMGDTRTPTKIGILTYAFGLLLKVAGFGFAGIKGMALAVSLCAVLYSCSLQYLLAKHWKVKAPIKQRATPETIGKFEAGF